VRIWTSSSGRRRVFGHDDTDHGPLLRAAFRGAGRRSRAGPSARTSLGRCRRRQPTSSPAPVALARPGAEQDDRQAREAGEGADGLGEGEPVHAGHLDVGDHEVGCEPPRLAVEAVGGATCDRRRRDARHGRVRPHRGRPRLAPLLGACRSSCSAQGERARPGAGASRSGPTPTSSRGRSSRRTCSRPSPSSSEGRTQEGPVIRVVVAERLADRPRAARPDPHRPDPRSRSSGQRGTVSRRSPLTQRLRPDLVTMDVHMPRLDGLAATREIMITAADADRHRPPGATGCSRSGRRWTPSASGRSTCWRSRPTGLAPSSRGGAAAGLGRQGGWPRSRSSAKWRQARDDPAGAPGPGARPPPRGARRSWRSPRRPGGPAALQSPARRPAPGFATPIVVVHTSPPAFSRASRPGWAASRRSA